MQLEPEILEWDSNFFGFKVGKIVVNKSNYLQLPQLIKNNDISNFKVLYLICEKADDEIHNAILEIHAKLVDQKIVYSKKIELSNTLIQSNYTISDYNDYYDFEELLHLAIESGQFSRFKIDLNFGNAKFQKLYTEWINKSLQKVIADKVIIVTDNNKIIGFVTLKNHFNSFGQIGLIAVSKEYRGKKLGVLLLQQCEKWYRENNLNFCKVVTQKNNETACHFYESFGYKSESISDIYHLWF